MNKTLLSTAAIALLGLGGIAQANITIETVAIGDAGNAADTLAGSRYGSVGYNYDIGKYEVTAGQYCAFLNAKANISDAYGLYNASMCVDTRGCQIQQTSVSGGYSYNVASVDANRPVNYISFWDSLRFSNWLGNGQGNSSTEIGAYTIPNGYNGTDGRTIARNAGATWAVTSENEWYKAAYYKGGDKYSLYANGTSTVPVDVTDSNYDLTIGSAWDGSINGSLEQNGTKDMMGNVWEWNEAVVPQFDNSASRGMRGGSFTYAYGYYYLRSSTRDSISPLSESCNIGFRVVQLTPVPEPTSLISLLGGLAGLIGLRRRKV